MTESDAAPLAVAVLETVSNQAFIFGTNRLREAVGASEMIYAAGVDLVLEALGHSKGEIEIARTLGGLRRFLKKRNGIEPMLIASGKAILLGPKDRLKDIIREVTCMVADRMPGLGMVGGIAPVESRNGKKTAGALHKAIIKAHDRVARLRSRTPSPLLRFQRLPVVADCESSGLPASGIDSRSPERDRVSEPVCAKRRYRDRGWRRLGQWLTRVEFAKDIDRLEEILQSRDARFIAVIHADGNGLGQIFLNFLSVAGIDPDAPYEEYVKAYQAFSLALDECTVAATKSAYDDVVNWLKAEKPEQEFRIIPLIIGGDDLTVICDGTMAVPFAAAFLRHFEEETQRHEGIRAVLGDRGLTAAAGIAIVKPHFPFFRAYELAESLLKSAKQVKKEVNELQKEAKGASALHYHVHFDSSGADWDRIKKRLEVKGFKNDEQAHLSVQPWVVTEPGEGHNDWSLPRRIEHLWKALAALRERNDDNRPLLPRSQQHALREALFRGSAIADARFKRIRHRYEDFKWASFLPQSQGTSLFFEEDGTLRTPLLDVMDLADLGTPLPESPREENREKEEETAS